MSNTLLQYCLLATAFTFLLWCFLYRNSSTRKLSMIPSVGPSGMLTSYIGAIRTLQDYNKPIQIGYDKYRGNMFKTPLLDRWIVVISGKELLQEYCRAKESDLSFNHATATFHQGQFTFGMTKNGWDNEFQLETVRRPITRNIAAKFDEVADEIKAAFSDVVDLYSKPGDNGWSAIPAVHTMADLVGRVSNRYFFNIDICRNKEFMDISVNYTIQAFVASTIINKFPTFLHPIVGPYFSPFNAAMKTIGRYINPIVEDRLENEKKYGTPEYPGRPSDLVSWLMDSAPENLRTPEGIAHRTLVIHLAAIHTSSTTLTHALFDLVSRPDYMEPLREEVKQVTSELGWTKDAMDKMYKVDSFIRESLRVNGLATLTMQRTVIKPDGMTFSNGVTLPYGTLVSIPERAIHDDPDNFDGEKFDGFRWLQKDGTSRESMVTAGVNCLNFGAGRHSCPGRFFAAVEVKAMLAHVIDAYDIKFEGGHNVRPSNDHYGHNISPNQKAHLLMKRRNP